MGTPHVKPTKEELKRQMQENLEKAEKLKKDKEAKPSPSTPPPSPSPSTPPAPSASPSPSESAPSASPSPSKGGTPSPSPSPSISDDEAEKERLRKKAAASSREAQLLHQKHKKHNEALDRAEAIKEPDDKTMEEEYGKDEWEEMSEGQKRLAKKNWVNEKRFEIMAKESKEGRDVQEWVEKVDKFVENPKTLIKYPELEGKQEEFKLFTLKETRRGLDMEDLVLAFNGELLKNPPKKKKGQMFEKGGSGKHKPQPKDGKLTAAQGRLLMKTDYKKFKELLKAGKIKNE